MKLSVILVSYNNLELLRDCLCSIKKFNDLSKETEIIVVEQSTEENTYITASSEFPNVRFIRNENVGFGRGNNRGAKEATGEYLLFLNTDTLLIEPVFRFAVNKFDGNAKLGAFGVQLLNGNRKKTLSFGVNQPFSKLSDVRTKVANLIGYFNPKKMYISGADFFIRRSVFEAIGGFDNNIFMYFEDTILSNEVLKRGYIVNYYPQVKIVHLQGGSSTSKRVLSSDSFLKSYSYYCEKNGVSFSKIIQNQIRYLDIEKKILGIASKRRASNVSKLSEDLKEYIERQKLINDQRDR